MVVVRAPFTREAKQSKEKEGKDGDSAAMGGSMETRTGKGRRPEVLARKMLSEGRAKHGQPDVVHTIPAEECLVTLLTILWLAVLGMMNVLPTNDKWSRFGFV